MRERIGQRTSRILGVSDQIGGAAKIVSSGAGSQTLKGKFGDSSSSSCSSSSGGGSPKLRRSPDLDVEQARRK